MSYACMILADDGLDITADKLSNILTAANVAVDPYWPEIYSKALRNIDKATIANMFGGSLQTGITPTNNGNY